MWASWLLFSYSHFTLLWASAPAGHPALGVFSPDTGKVPHWLAAWKKKKQPISGKPSSSYPSILPVFSSWLLPVPNKEELCGCIFIQMHEHISTKHIHIYMYVHICKIYVHTCMYRYIHCEGFIHILLRLLNHLYNLYNIQKLYK